MPGVTARTAAKNQSKGNRAKAAKNARRVDAAVNDELTDCTYGKITKTLGNKTFRFVGCDKKEGFARIRGKMARIGINDVVLLNVREYESRAGSDEAVYDIMALFSSRDISKLIKNGTIPEWMSAGERNNDDDELGVIFDYSEDSDDDEEDGNPKKKDKVSHRKAGKNAIDVASDSDQGEINIDDI
jgi:translation initiation factor IF-1